VHEGDVAGEDSSTGKKPSGGLADIHKPGQKVLGYRQRAKVSNVASNGWVVKDTKTAGKGKGKRSWAKKRRSVPMGVLNDDQFGFEVPRRERVRCRWTAEQQVSKTGRALELP